MNNETSNASNPIGLYKDPASGKYIGAIHEAQADAMIQQGYRLVKEGYDAAMLTEKEILAKVAAVEGSTEPQPPVKEAPDA